VRFTTCRSIPRLVANRAKILAHAICDWMRCCLALFSRQLDRDRSSLAVQLGFGSIRNANRVAGERAREREKGGTEREPETKRLSLTFVSIAPKRSRVYTGIMNFNFHVSAVSRPKSLMHVVPPSSNYYRRPCRTRA